MGRRMKKMLQEKIGDQPIVVGASCLLRTQQTAYYMLQPPKIVIVPYISEVGASGDNSPVSPKEQATILQTQTCGWPDFSDTRDFSYFNAAPGAANPNPGKFLDWLAHTYGSLVDEALGTPLFFVSHGGFIRKLIFHAMTGAHGKTIHQHLFEETKGPWTPSREKHELEAYLNNYRAFEFKVTLRHDPDSGNLVADVTDIGYFRYEDESTTDYLDNTSLQTKKECEVDTCRYRVCRPSGFAQEDMCKSTRANPSLSPLGKIIPEAVGLPYVVGGRSRRNRRGRRATRKRRM